MSIGLEDPELMAKPKTLSVKVHMDVVESARIVAAFKGVTITDLVSDTMRPILARMEQEEMTRRMKPRRPKGGDP